MRTIEDLEHRFKAEYSSHLRLRTVEGLAHVIGYDHLPTDAFPYPIPFLVQEFI